MRRETGFAGRLRALREWRGLTLQELADRAGLSLQGLAKLESDKPGWNREPQWSTVLALAAALRVRVTAFLPDAKTPPGRPKPSAKRRKTAQK